MGDPPVGGVGGVPSARLLMCRLRVFSALPSGWKLRGGLDGSASEVTSVGPRRLGLPSCRTADDWPLYAVGRSFGTRPTVIPWRCFRDAVCEPAADRAVFTTSTMEDIRNPISGGYESRCFRPGRGSHRGTAKISLKGAVGSVLPGQQGCDVVEGCRPHVRLRSFREDSFSEATPALGFRERRDLRPKALLRDFREQASPGPGG